jgi:DNA-binding transcriptional ArsR family regulator
LYLKDSDSIHKYFCYKDISCSATAKILDVLWEYQDMDLTLTDIADEAGIHYTTLMKALPELEKHGLVTMTRQVGNAKLYQINRDDIVVKRLVKFLNSLNIRFAEKEIVKQNLQYQNIKEEPICARNALIRLPV